MECLQPCTDFTYQSQTTTSSYPAATTFLSSQEACMLVIKLFQVRVVYVLQWSQIQILCIEAIYHAITKHRVWGILLALMCVVMA